MSSVRDMTYSELEKRYTPLIIKFSRSYVSGMDSDDIAQELRVVLARAQRNYDPNRGESGFMHFLYCAFQNRMGQLACRPRARKRVPLTMQMPLEGVDAPSHESGFERVELEAGLSPTGRKIVRSVLDQGMTLKELKALVSPDEFEGVKAELRRHLPMV